VAQAIIVLADAVGTPLDAAFTTGGDPFLIQLSSDFYEADFVIATTSFDSGSSTTGTSRSPEVSRPATSASPTNRQSSGIHRERSTSTTASNTRNLDNNRAKLALALPLFHPPSQQDHEQDGGVGGDSGFGGEDEFDFGVDEFDMAALDAAEVAASQALSQKQAQAQAHVLVPDTRETRNSGSVVASDMGSASGSVSRRTTKSVARDVAIEPFAEEDDEGEFGEAGPSYPRTQLGPTQPAEGRDSKKVRTGPRSSKRVRAGGG